MFNRFLMAALAVSAGIGLLCSSEPAAAAQVPSDLAGTWVIEQDLGAAPISALSNAEVSALLGSTVTIDDSLCSVATTSQLPSLLRGGGNTMRTVDFSCAGVAKSFVMQPQDSSRALFASDGHYFVAVKQPAAAVVSPGQSPVKDHTLMFSLDVPIFTFHGGNASEPFDRNEPILGNWQVSMTEIPGVISTNGRQASAIRLNYYMGGNSNGTAFCPVFQSNGRTVVGQCTGQVNLNAVDGMYVSNGVLFIEGRELAPGDPRCCGSAKRRWTIELRGNALVVTGKDDLGTVSP